mmetsp:Transcript_11610/g.41769  ORF Transcript_11610/g.41769 Transcript_11610/m.41769 type:complete len:200 (+) Transcript_11610:1039-1638(+)
MHSVLPSTTCCRALVSSLCRSAARSSRAIASRSNLSAFSLDSSSRISSMIEFRFACASPSYVLRSERRRSPMSVLFWPVAADADGANASVVVAPSAPRSAAATPARRETETETTAGGGGAEDASSSRGASAARAIDDDDALVVVGRLGDDLDDDVVVFARARGARTPLDAVAHEDAARTEDARGIMARVATCVREPKRA